MDFNFVMQVVSEELLATEAKIRQRLGLEGVDENNNFGIVISKPLPPLPNNEKYRIALELYKAGASHSKVSRELGTPMNNTKRYYNWLVNNGYLEIVPRELSETEKKIVIRREKSMSFAAIGGELGMSVPNVIQRYNNAKAKGYVESDKE